EPRRWITQHPFRRCSARSLSCGIVAADTWPAGPTWNDGAQRWPRRRTRRRGGNSANRLRAVLLLNHWIASEGATAGGAEKNRWTGSGRISSARISTPFACATSLSRPRRRSATAADNTRVRYFGIHTAWSAV